MRTGLIAQKIGMTCLFKEDGQHVPVTVLKCDDCVVTAVRSSDKDGYTAVQLGLGARKEKNVSKAMQGHFKKAGVTPKKHVREFRVSDDCLLNLGDHLSVDHFLKGQFVDVTGLSIGRGFAGVMKRHNFGGVRATHGTEKTERQLGSSGSNQDPGRVMKGKKMPGHMGVRRVTVQNLEVVDTDANQGLLLVKGAVPGSKGGWVYIHDSVKRSLPQDLPMPAGLKSTAGHKKAGPSEKAAASADDVQAVTDEKKDA